MRISRRGADENVLFVSEIGNKHAKHRDTHTPWAGTRPAEPAAGCPPSRGPLLSTSDMTAAVVRCKRGRGGRMGSHGLAPAQPRAIGSSSLVKRAVLVGMNNRRPPSDWPIAGLDVADWVAHPSQVLRAEHGRWEMGQADMRILLSRKFASVYCVFIREIDISIHGGVDSGTRQRLFYSSMLSSDYGLTELVFYAALWSASQSTSAVRAHSCTNVVSW